MTSKEINKTKKQMTPAELFEYATDQIEKAENEGDKAGTRLDALQDILTSAVDVLKQSAGGVEDLENTRIEVAVYQEPGLSSVPDEKEIPVSSSPSNDSIDKLLAKVDELRKELLSDENQGNKAEPGAPPDKSVSWPADMTTTANAADVEKNQSDDKSWGSDPSEVRGPSS